MFKIGIVTTTRAEYGLLNPFIRRVIEDDELELSLYVSGTHLSKRHGLTINEIINDGIPISHQVQIMEQGNNPIAVSKMMANAIIGFAECFQDDRPDMLVVSGDRTEMLAIACAAMNDRIPMAHYSGGEVTEGAIDDCIRHSLSKMSYLHFTSTELYRKRVISLGEHPDRVINVGALGMENIKNVLLLSENEIRMRYSIPLEKKYSVVTFHPVTLDAETPKEQAIKLLKAMEQEDKYFYLITKANADVGGDDVNALFEEYVSKNNNAILVDSLGMKKYLSAVKYAAFVLGNSSSGMVEAPVLGTPTINIGDRQKGRIVAETVINCHMKTADIINAIKQAEYIEHKPTTIFGDGTSSNKMIAEIKRTLHAGTIDLRKGFYEGERAICV